MAQLVIENLTHFYKKNCALSNITTTLNNGVVALIGPNGAGKTTFINIIVGMLSPSKGQILFNNKNIKEFGEDYYNYIGYCPQTPQFYNNFTAMQFMLYLSSLKKINKKISIENINSLLEQVNLSQYKYKKIGTFSGGMKQRLGIAQALLNNPELLILDEPTAGLDPIERIRFRNMISEISSNRIVILATHIIADVESISNQIIFLRKGNLLFNNSCEELLMSIKNQVWKISDITSEQLKILYKNYIIANIKTKSENLYEIKVIGNQPHSFNYIPIKPTLEDAFLLFFNESTEKNSND